jgi:hypothetical protein
LRILAARARRGQGLCLVVAAAAGCHSEPAPPAVAAAFPRVSAADGSASGLDSPIDPASEAPSLETLAEMGASLAPGMREVARGQSPMPASIPLLATNADVCLRAVFGAASPVIAALLAEPGGILAITRAGTRATLEARGPVCMRKGQSVHIEVQGQAPLVRYVVWMTP